MMDLFVKLGQYFQYPFVKNALLVGVLIALCSSLLGVTLVLKRLSFIGDGLSHVAFGGMCVASVVSALPAATLIVPAVIAGGFLISRKRRRSMWIAIGCGLLAVVLLAWKLPFTAPYFSNAAQWTAKLIQDHQMILIIPVTIAAAIGLLIGGKNRKIKGDASLAMLSVGALGLGYLIINRFSQSGNISGDVCTTLFGSTSILTLSKFDVWLCIVMSVIVITVFVLLYNRIFAVTFDETFTTATGTKASAYNLIIAIVTAVIIVLAMKLVGSLLISALVIFPSLSAMRVFKSFKSVVICSAVVSVFCSVVGILASIVWSTPVGSTIVAIDLAVFLIFSIIGLTKGNKSFTIQTKTKPSASNERIADL